MVSRSGDQVCRICSEIRSQKNLHAVVEGATEPLNQMTEGKLEAFIARSQKVIEDGGERPTIIVKP